MKVLGVTNAKIAFGSSDKCEQWGDMHFFLKSIFYFPNHCYYERSELLADQNSDHQRLLTGISSPPNLFPNYALFLFPSILMLFSNKF